MQKMNNIEIHIPSKILNEKNKVIDVFTKKGNIRTVKKQKLIKIVPDSNISEPIIISTNDRLNKLQEELNYKVKPKKGIVNRIQELIDSNFNKIEPEMIFTKKKLQPENIEVIDNKISNQNIIESNVKPNKKSNIVSRIVKVVKKPVISKIPDNDQLISMLENTNWNYNLFKAVKLLKLIQNGKIKNDSAYLQVTSLMDQEKKDRENEKK